MLGIDLYNYTALTQIRQITAELLTEYTTEQIIEAGWNVIVVLSDFNKDHPDKIPTKPGHGLLNIGPVRVDDFELALHLVRSNYPAMVEVIERAKGLSPLIAYLEVRANNPVLRLTNSIIDSALGYAISSMKFDGDVAKLLNQELKKDVLRLRPLAMTGQKFVTGRKPMNLGPVAKMIKAFLQKYPKAKPVVVWVHLKNAPPKGMVFMENERFGRYIEKGCETVMKWERFQNLVSEHRP